MRNAEGNLLGPNKWFPVSASITEQNIYGRKQISMSITYTVSGTFIGEIMRHGGLFIPRGPTVETAGIIGRGG